MAEESIRLNQGFERQLGKRLRALRRTGGFALAQVAEATGISTSFISHIENGKSDITIGRLIRLADFYGIDINDLLPGRSHTEPEVIRKGEHTHLPSPGEHLEIFLLGPDQRRSMLPILTHYEPGGRTTDTFSAEGENFLYVLEGSVRVTWDDGHEIVLEAGDSAYYEADLPHRYANAGDGPARLISCATRR
jgi:quercetin dioxygenase-like cupin family protein/DNA-binding XRE family transcriptional regulator